jgi:hypothetical protein
MTFPGFNAQTSLYRSSEAYCGASAGWGDPRHQTVRLTADSCTCTSPSCTWQCPAPDPCEGCARLTGCAGLLCYCRCYGGIAIEVGSSQSHPCGWVCT